MHSPNSLETRYRIALAVGQIGLWNWDAATGLLSFDDRTREIFGLASEPQMTLPDMERLVHPDDRDTRQASWRRARRSHRQWRTRRRVPPDPTDERRCRTGWRRRPRSTFVNGARVAPSASCAMSPSGAATEAIFAGIVAIAADAIITIDDAAAHHAVQRRRRTDVRLCARRSARPIRRNAAAGAVIARATRRHVGEFGRFRHLGPHHGRAIGDPRPAQEW